MIVVTHDEREKRFFYLSKLCFEHISMCQYANAHTNTHTQHISTESQTQSALKCTVSQFQINQILFGVNYIKVNLIGTI